jgi:hypothetical protein
MITLVIDTGMDIVGIFSVAGGKYVPYRGVAISSAIGRIQAADEVVRHADIRTTMNIMETL